ncbi:helix-turn-helix transcriptional regulator [uncultured Neglectibacter sp.]|uniref:helix-turn-helix transcriptional regulator n=1 Tax=uncultured Neglectibacter sp. TaxID=1924108 RepID=UPI0034DE9F63
MKIVDQKTVGAIAKRLRLDTGYSQEMVAYALNMNRSGYSYKEIGKTAFSLYDLQRLAILYGISTDVFFQLAPYPEQSRAVRVKRKVSPNVGRVGELAKDEKKLIELLRIYHSFTGTDRLIKQLQKTVEEELMLKTS